MTQSPVIASTVTDSEALSTNDHNIGDKVKYLNKENIDVSATIPEVTRDLNNSHVYLIMSEDGIETHTSSNNINSDWKASDELHYNLHQFN